MSDADDLLGKADALLNRYRPDAAHAPAADIPLLTDVVELAPPAVASGDSPAAAESPPAGELLPGGAAPVMIVQPVAAMGDAAAAAGHALDEVSLVEVNLVEATPAAAGTESRAADIHRHVLAALERFLGDEFDLRLRAGLDLAVHRLAFDLLAEIRGDLNTLVGEAVARALAEKGNEHESIALEPPGQASPRPQNDMPDPGEPRNPL